MTATLNFKGNGRFGTCDALGVAETKYNLAHAAGLKAVESEGLTGMNDVTSYHGERTY